MGKDKLKQQTTARIRSKDRQQKESQKSIPRNLKRMGNTRIRRISGHR